MKFNRLIALLMVLLNKDKTSARELADHFEVSTRTIYRDLDTLLVAGIPINTTLGVNGGVSIEKGFKLDKNFFSMPEISRLMIGINGIESLFNDESSKSLNGKVRSLIPESRVADMEKISSQIEIDLTSWQGWDSINGKIASINKALLNSNSIEFDYINKSNGVSSREVEPYKLTLKENSWYLEGFCLKRDSFRMFKVSRMLNLRVTKRNFYKREFTPQDLSKNGWVKERLIFIDVEFKRNILEEMIERCGEDNVQVLDNLHYRATMPFMDDEYSYNTLLGYGTNIKCLGPEYVIEGLKKHIKKIEEIYS